MDRGKGTSESGRKRSMFAQCVYWVNPCMAQSIQDNMIRLLNAHGAVQASAIDNAKQPRSRFDLKTTTHIVSQDLLFREAEVAEMAGIAIVTPQWVTNSVRLGHADFTEFYSADPAQLFSGITVAASSTISTSDVELLFGGVSAYGGQWREHMDVDVTHLLTLDDSAAWLVAQIDGGDECVAIQRQPKYSHTKMIVPHWINDCYQLKRRLPQDAYVFPNPLILQPWPDTQDVDPESQLDDYPTLTLNPQLHGFRIILSSDLDLKDDMATWLLNKLAQAHVTVVDEHENVGDVDAVVCKYRAGPLYDKACRLGKHVGTFYWLCGLLYDDKIPSAQTQLLFYPQPPSPHDDFGKFVVSTTNFCQYELDYIRKLLDALGAAYTPNLTRANTHLICASKGGTKWEKALEWNVAMVNHLWLEECYREWQVLSITKPSYQQYPSHDQLQLLLGHTPLRNQDIKAWNNRNKVHDKPEAVVEVYESDTERHVKRSAAQEASRELKRLMEAANLYEKEMKQSKSKTVDKGKAPVAKPPPPAEPTKPTKAPPPPVEPTKPPVPLKRLTDTTKKRKDETPPMTSSPPPVAKKHKNDLVVYMCTQVTLTDAETKGFKALGARTATTIKKCTHLITKSVLRTEKFLSAITCGTVTYIVTLDWVRDSVKQGKLLPEKDYLLNDEAAEALYDFTLAESLRRSKERNLLQGIFVYITSKQPNAVGVDVLGRLVTLAGGKVLPNLSTKRLSELKDRILIISSEDDKDIWTPLKTYMLQHHHKELDVYSAEFLLRSLLKQELAVGKTFAL